MDEIKIKELLEKLRKGEIDTDFAIDKLRNLPYQDLGFAKVDHHRALRQGFPEVIFAQGKQSDQIKAIALAMLEKESNILVTRINKEQANVLLGLDKGFAYHEHAQICLLEIDPLPKNRLPIVIVGAGTSDLPVIDEAYHTANIMGNNVIKLVDVGVAGIHRLIDKKKILDSAGVIIVVAGMEGALASVVAGMVNAPVIAVPTSIGYGASFKGLAALLTMLNSCVPSVVVVNIDNGFGAAFSASIINQKIK